MGAALAPLGVILVAFQLFIWFAPKTKLVTALIIVGILFCVSVFWAGRYIVRKLQRYRNDRLGYLGERVVGEALEPLIADGFRVFHDVPAEVKKLKFNVDHVVVGPNGVFAIETKTRRKGRVRPGMEAHKVIYDGQQLSWPWAEDSYGLQNAIDRARWLAEWLNRKTGLGLSVQPVLAVPGWYVVPKGLGPVLVLNQKQLCGAIPRHPGSPLTAQQVDLIGRQLDDLCRDVDE